MEQGADPRAEQRVGAVLDEKWTLEHLLGSGGMGAVYAARHRNGARAAVKILHPELARMPEVRERFLREGYAANRVEHRGAVQVLDDDLVKGGVDEGSAYLVMELLEGESLQERVGRTPKLGERELLEVMDAVLDVLSAAHDNGVVHRDLKPENIFLARDPERDGVRVKVLDFGLARVSETSNVTNAGIAVGTPSFMSPEQAAGRGDEIDGRTDIFALGATVFRIVTGRRIHDADNMVQLVVLMATMPAPRLQSVTPDVSDSFARIIDRALAFEREDRYPDAASMRADVRAAIDGGVRGTAASLQVIPFSARNVRIESMPEAPAITEPAAPVRAKVDSDVTSDAKEAGFFGEPAAEEEPSAEAAPAHASGRSTTLPWALVLLLLAAFAWKLGPSLQEALVRRASLEPVRQLWSSPSGSASTTANDPPPTEPPAASNDPRDLGPTPSTLDIDDDGGVVDDDDSTDTPESAPGPASPSHDAGAPRVVATARPHPPQPPHATKPAPKKPAPKKPPPRHR